MVQAAQQPLYDGCSTYSELSAVVRLLSIKSDYNMPQNYFNEIVQLMKEMCPPNNRVPNNYGKRRRFLKISTAMLSKSIVTEKVACYFIRRTQTWMRASFVGIQDGRGKGHNKGQNPLPYNTIML